MKNISKLEESVISSLKEFNNKSKERIDIFEKDWMKWDINDTLKWFKYILYNNNNNNNNNIDYDSDYSIESDETESESDSNSYGNNGKDMINIEDYKYNENENENENINNIDFILIKNKLLKHHFKAKYYLNGMKKGTFKKFGFKNQFHYRLLYKQTQLLIEKYPRNRKKIAIKDKKMPKQNPNAMENIRQEQLEGFVENTGS